MGKRHRKQEKFWLDVSRREDRQLLNEIKGLKKSRIFTQSIRDGLRLLADLRAGRTDVLIELFPHIRQQLSATQDVSQDIEELKQLIRQSNIGAVTPDRSMMLDDDLTVSVSKVESNGEDSVKNFTDSMMSLF